jgi:DNA-binding NarL/FixJ family response regulator
VTIRVLIADDQPLMRTGFRMILDAEPDLEVVGEAADGGDAVRLAGHVRADVVLMDIRMPGMDGIEATRRLAGEGVTDPVRVLILTTFDLDEYVLSALRAGASGFLLKDVPPEDLVDAIKVVAAGDALLAPSVTRRLLDRFASKLPDPAATRPAALDSLTARELEVLGMVARGMSNAEIAEHLVVSETTVKTHVGRLLAKLDLRDRVQAVVLAYETGIVRPGRGRPSPSVAVELVQARRRPDRRAEAAPDDQHQPDGGEQADRGPRRHGVEQHGGDQRPQRRDQQRDRPPGGSGCPAGPGTSRAARSRR